MHRCAIKLEHYVVVAANLESAFTVNTPDSCHRHAAAIQHHLDLRQLAFCNLHHRAEFFAEQLPEQIDPGSGQRKRCAEPACKNHLRDSGEQPAVATIMVGEQHVTGVQFLDRRKKTTQKLSIIEIWRSTTGTLVRLQQTRSAKTIRALAEIKQQEVTGLADFLQLRRQVTSNVADRSKCGDDQ